MSINRIRLEFKAVTGLTRMMMNTNVLIESDWNLKGDNEQNVSRPDGY